MSLAKNYQEKIVPQRITLAGSADDEFVVQKADGTQVLVVTGDGKIGHNGGTPVGKGAALTTAVVAPGSFTHTAPGADDYAFQGVTQTTPFGYVNANEGNSHLKATQNLLQRVADIEARLQAAGIIL